LRIECYEKTKLPNSINMNKTQINQPQSVNGAFVELLNKMYISNVQNRLRQLNEPTDNDCQRWVWELIQNAKDSISNDENRKSVDIRILVRDNDVMFSHNGSPFTAKAQLGLLYKYSEGKVNNSESTGRFGTGFLTTHTLSKIVSIEGDVFTDNLNNPLCGFSATMYRDGLDELELLEGVKKMKESMIYTAELNEWTTYTYHLKTHQNKKALELGLKNFISNIAQVMLFCKELNTIELDNNGSCSKIYRKQPQLLQNEIYISEFVIEGQGSQSRKFIHKYLKKPCEELTLRFKTNRNLRLMTAIEIDDDDNLVENENAPSHFCVLPLVGSEKHIMPIYLNSPDFEPDSERESLILIGEDILADKGVISEGGINRLILEESIELYGSLVAYLSENNFHKLHLLAKGLKKVPDFEKNFNRDWFENEIMLPYREVLKKYSVVETENGNQKLFNEDSTPNIIIPVGNKEVRQKIYALTKELFPNNLPLEKYASDWAHMAWKDCGTFEIEDLCNFVAKRQNALNLPSYEWLNRFILFIKEASESFLKKYAVVPNSNGDFISLENQDFAEGVGLTEFMLDTLLALGIDLKPKLLNPRITTISLPVKVDAKSIAEKIDEEANVIIKNTKFLRDDKIEKLLPLLNLIPTNTEKYSTDFIEKQKYINGFARIIFENFQITEQKNNDIPEKAWNSTHKWLISILIDIVSEYKKIYSLPEKISNKTQWLNDFITFVSKEIKEGKLDEVKIIPNQNGDFCFKKDLSIDDNIPEILKTEKAESFGLLLKQILLHNEIHSVNISSKIGINIVVEKINEIFKNNKFENLIEDLDFAIYLIHLLPDTTSQILHNSQNTLLTIVRKYYQGRCDLDSTHTISCNSEDFWRKANDKIITSLQCHISEEASLEGLQMSLSDSGVNYDKGDTIIFLNDFYNYLNSIKIAIESSIIPNQKGTFCLLDDLYKDDNIPEELKQVLFLVDSENDFKNILAEESLSIQPKHNKGVSDIAKLIDDAVKETFADTRNWEDEDFKKAIEILTEYFRKHKSSKDLFTYTWNKKDSIELNVLWNEKDREILKELKENGIEKVQLLFAKDAEIAKLKKEKDELLAENQKLKKDKQTLEQEIEHLKNQLENATTDTEKDTLQEALLSKINLLQEKNNEMAIIESCVNNGLSKQRQKEINEEAREIVKQELEKRLTAEQRRHQSIGKNFTYQLIGFEGYSNSPIMQINGVNYSIIVKSYKKQTEQFNINAIEWEQALTQPKSLFLVWDGNKINHIDILGLLKNQSHIDISFSTVNLDIEERLNKFSQSMRYFKDIQFKFSSFYSSAFGQATKLSNYFFDSKQENDVNDDNSDIML
jgi:hypothetical protein